MKAFVIIATKGRPGVSYECLNTLKRQTHPIEHIYVVGSELNDTNGLENHALLTAGKVSIKYARGGLTTQRNAGLDALRFEFTATMDPEDWFVVFLDDDFRIAPDWLEHCANGFQTHPNVVGAGGCVLADGITKNGISESEAHAYLNGYLPAKDNYWAGVHSRSVPDLYGCNMAYRGTFALNQRFDEKLPAYGWQEDVDYSVRAAGFGELRYLPKAKGVHLGVTGGRVSGLSFGYSQIANPVYLIKKATIRKRKALLLMSRNIISNCIKTLTLNTQKDYRGRLYGNYLAFCDTFKQSCDPENIKQF